MNKVLRIVACVLAVVATVVIGYVVVTEVEPKTNVADNQQQDDLNNARKAYIENPDLFECSWSSEFDVPDWMTDYNEKLAAYADTDGRMMSVFHKGDFKHYPENSIEAVISAIKMGADAVEVDLCLTKDKVVVLMHDATDLSRSTDWFAKNGTNGLPKSQKVGDWTLAELQQLNLVMEDGSETDYIIPTFEEVLSVCKGRTKLVLDKTDDWAWKQDVHPLIEKYEAWDTCILPRTYSFSNKNNIAKVLKAAGGGSGIYAFEDIGTASSNGWEEVVSKVKDSGNDYILYWAASSVTKQTIEKTSQDLSKIAGTIRIFAQNHKSMGGNETDKYWSYLWENGVNIVLSDEGMSLQKYIAANFEPTAY